MGVVLLLVSAVLKAAFLALPLCVAWLAFRRLLLSTTRNAWAYAAMGLFAAFSAAGLAPWVLGLAPAKAGFIAFAAISPLLWLAVVIVCGPGAGRGYDRPLMDEIPVEDRALSLAARDVPAGRGARAPALILERPQWPDAPRAVFRHRSGPGMAEAAAGFTPAPGPAPRAAAPSTRAAHVLNVARDMRGNADTQARRARPALPPPGGAGDLPDLPFLRPGR